MFECKQSEVLIREEQSAEGYEIPYTKIETLEYKEELEGTNTIGVLLVLVSELSLLFVGAAEFSQTVHFIPTEFIVVLFSLFLLGMVLYVAGESKTQLAIRTEDDKYELHCNREEYERLAQNL